MITQERLKELLDYDPETGVFRWRVDRGSSIKAGSIAGAHFQNRVTLVLDRKHIDAGPAAWLYVYGDLPPYPLDHINGDPLDNRLANLKPIAPVDKSKPLTAERLREVLNYNPETGIFTRRTRHGGTKPGRQTGTVCPATDYVKLSVDNRRYAAHRLAWLYVYGRWPEPCVDHRNGDRTDNRIGNLREASSSENGHNRPAPTNRRGVTPVRGKWLAQISHKRKHYNLGLFESMEDARRAYIEAAERLYGEFARLE